MNAGDAIVSLLHWSQVFRLWKVFVLGSFCRLVLFVLCSGQERYRHFDFVQLSRQAQLSNVLHVWLDFYEVRVNVETCRLFSRTHR